MFSILKLKKSSISFKRQSSIWAGSVVNMLHFFNWDFSTAPWRGTTYASARHRPPNI